MNDRPTATRRLPALVCLDFDGTILALDGVEPVFDRAAIDVLNDLAARGIAWCANSGRDRSDQRAILERSYDAGLNHRPVALMCSESLIFPARGGDYESLEPWNTEVGRCMAILQQALREALDRECADLLVRHQPRTFFTQAYTAFLLPVSDEGLLSRFHDELEAVLSARTDAVVTRNGSWFNCLPRSAGKGAILSHFARRYGYAQARILAVGDHINDLSMLDGEAAASVGCPSDAYPAVRERVRAAGGRVAASPGPSGTVEIIRAWAKQMAEA